HELEPVDSYTDENCMKCGSCLQGCPTNAGKNTMNTYIHAATAVGKLDLRAECPVERDRMERGLDFAKRAMKAAGATRVAWTGPASTHVQGTCRMGSDPARSVVDANCESHDAKRLFVGDASLFPKTLSVNPSMTIMALADRLAQHLDDDPNRYLSAQAAEVTA
ncbi:MAG TPA: GMC oxidoreductase, partial [Solirubrobacterales bacterium]|nr:GMC oxidoreductase [Solirubrobacterales bacterium]